jgi:hypothetical protein
MKNNVNVSNVMVNPGKSCHLMIRKVLFACGILSSLLWVGADILAAIVYEGYSYTSQAISELSAIGAPTKPLLGTTGAIYEVLLFAFGLGVLVMAGQKRTLRITGILLITHAVLALVSFFFPMNLREAEKTISDTMHAIIYTLIPLVILFIIWFGSNASGKWFRIYSIGTIFILILFGALTGMASPRIAAGLPTPWVGIYERINVYGYMVWVILLAIILLRREQAENS